MTNKIQNDLRGNALLKYIKNGDYQLGGLWAEWLDFKIHCEFYCILFPECPASEVSVQKISASKDANVWGWPQSSL